MEHMVTGFWCSAGKLLFESRTQSQVNTGIPFNGGGYRPL
jgi:hypothetical protein